MGFSFKFIYKDDVPLITELFSNLKEGTYKLEEYFTRPYAGNRCRVFDCSITIKKANRPNTLSAGATEERYSDVKWFSFHMRRKRYYYNTGKQEASHKDKLDRGTYIAQIKTRGSTFLVMRNGDNVSRYNFLIFDCNKKKNYFRASCTRAHFVMDINTMERKELPLLLGYNNHEDDLNILQKKFKGEL